MKKTKEKNGLLICMLVLILITAISCGYICLDNNAQFANASTDLDSTIDVKTDLENFSDIKYIPNSNYFIANPYHHSNKDGESANGICTTVALELLLGYHNYYTDRRLIPKEADGKQFLDESYGDLIKHPYINSEPCTDNDGLGSKELGLCDSVFDEIVNLSAFSEIGLDQMLNNATTGANKFLKKYAKTNNDISLKFGLINKNTVLAEIDAGRPVVLGMAGKSSNGEYDFHVVTIYGYATYKGEFGYIGHWGWGYGSVQMWGPERWFAFQVTMNVDHNHNYVECKEDINNTHRKFECTDCGCTTIDELYKVNADGTEIVGLNYEPLANVTVPNSITKIGNGVFENSNVETIDFNNTVSEIGDNAFKNCSNLKKIVLTNNLKYIGKDAFYKCGALTNISFSYKLRQVCEGAFAGCNNLNISVESYNAYYSADSNVLYNKDKTKIIASGKVSDTITIPNTVTEIAPSAFEGNNNLKKVYFGKNNPLIGENSFADCSNLNEVYFYDYNVSSIPSSSFANDVFTAYVPYISLGSYSEVLGSNSKTTSVLTTLFYVSDAQVIAQQDVYYGSVLNSLYLPNKDGYSFAGWYRNPDLQGDAVCDGALWEETTDTSLYADWQIVEYNVFFNLNGGTLTCDNPMSYTVEDNIIFEIPTKTGYTFAGWTIDGQAVDGIGKGTYGDIEADANWTANTYTVTFDVNGGASQLQPISVVFEQEYRIDTIPTKEGHIFDGWFDQKDVGVCYATADGVSTRLWDKAENTTLYAHWSLKSYQIQINSDGTIVWIGENGLSLQPCEITYGTIINCINLVPEFKKMSASYREGRIFDHFEYENDTVNWTSIPDLGDNGAVISIIPAWVLEEHTIHFITKCNITVPAIQAEYGTPIDLSTVNREGYNFVGWFTQEQNGERVTWKTMPDLTVSVQNNGSCEVYARYELINYTISYNLDGGTNSASNPTVYNVESNIKLYNPTKIGHTFNGWYLNSAKTMLVDTNNFGFGNKTLYAKWNPNKYSVTLDKQGGAGGNSNVLAVYGQKLESKTAPTRIGYTFKGYFSQPNGQGKQYYDSDMQGEIWDELKNITLYACWEANIYKITLHNINQYNPNDIGYIYATYGSVVPELEGFAPEKEGYAFEGFYSNPNGKGIKYYKMEFANSPREAAALGYDEYWREKPVPCQEAIWSNAFDGDLYAHFVLLEMDYVYVRMDNENKVGLGVSQPIHLRHGETVKVTAETVERYVFEYFTIGTRKITTSIIDFNVKLQRGEGSKEVYSAYSLTAWYKKDSCIASGTLITLADGRQVPVESLKGNEMLLVWNMLTGKFDASRILFIDKDPAQIYKVINLGFSDGTTVKVISEHGFWDYDLNKYVYLREDASKYIGHRFNKQIIEADGSYGNAKVQLVSVKVCEEYTTAYSPVTYAHLCYYVNGMLSMPGGITGLFNIFEVNPETMTIDVGAMARDIEQYGLFTYEEFAELLPISEDAFNAFNGQYLKIAIGKGLTDMDTLQKLAEHYAEFL